MGAYRDDVTAVLVAAFGGEVFGVRRDDGRVLWKYTFPPRGDGRFASRSSGVLALLVTTDAVYAASYDGQVCCLRYPTGEKVWSVKTRITGRATLLLDAGRLFVGRKGDVECLALDGTVLWHTPFYAKGDDPVNAAFGVALGVPGSVVQADENSGG
jgi:outer membrane protein assembly factor BamB